VTFLLVIYKRTPHTGRHDKSGRLKHEQFGEAGRDKSQDSVRKKDDGEGVYCVHGTPLLRFGMPTH
jgi:hypothetical protein